MLIKIPNSFKLSEQLKEIRVRHNLSQKDVALATHKSMGYISNIEKNKAKNIETDIVRFYYQLEFGDNAETELSYLMPTMDNAEQILTILFSKIVDTNKNYASEKIGNILLNIKSDISLMFAYMAVNISILRHISYDDKKLFLKDIDKLVLQYYMKYSEEITAENFIQY